MTFCFRLGFDSLALYTLSPRVPQGTTCLGGLGIFIFPLAFISALGQAFLSHHIPFFLEFGFHGLSHPCSPGIAADLQFLSQQGLPNLRSSLALLAPL